MSDFFLLVQFYDNTKNKTIEFVKENKARWEIHLVYFERYAGKFKTL